MCSTYEAGLDEADNDAVDALMGMTGAVLAHWYSTVWCMWCCWIQTTVPCHHAGNKELFELLQQDEQIFKKRHVTLKKRQWKRLPFYAIWHLPLSACVLQQDVQYAHLLHAHVKRISCLKKAFYLGIARLLCRSAPIETSFTAHRGALAYADCSMAYSLDS